MKGFELIISQSMGPGAERTDLSMDSFSALTTAEWVWADDADEPINRKSAIIAARMCIAKNGSGNHLIYSIHAVNLSDTQKMAVASRRVRTADEIASDITFKFEEWGIEFKFKRGNVDLNATLRLPTPRLLDSGAVSATKPWTFNDSVGPDYKDPGACYITGDCENKVISRRLFKHLKSVFENTEVMAISAFLRFEKDEIITAVDFNLNKNSHCLIQSKNHPVVILSETADDFLLMLGLFFDIKGVELRVSNVK